MTFQDIFALLIEGYEDGVDAFLASQILPEAESNPAWGSPIGQLAWMVGMTLGEKAASGNGNG